MPARTRGGRQRRARAGLRETAWCGQARSSSSTSRRAGPRQPVLFSRSRHMWHASASPLGGSRRQRQAAAGRQRARTQQSTTTRHAPTTAWALWCRVPIRQFLGCCAAKDQRPQASWARSTRSHVVLCLVPRATSGNGRAAQQRAFVVVRSCAGQGREHSLTSVCCCCCCCRRDWCIRWPGSAITGPVAKECADLWPRIASAANSIV